MSTCSIGVIAHRMSRGFGEIHYFRQLSEAASQYNIPLIVFSVDDVDVKNKTIHALVYQTDQKKWIKKVCPFPKVVYDRVRYHPTEQFRRYTRLRKSGVLNFSYHGYSHKLGVCDYLSSFPDLKPYIPETEKVVHRDQVIQFLKGGTSILKPVNGSGGRGVYQIKLDNSLIEVSGRPLGGTKNLTPHELTPFLKSLVDKESYMIQRKIPITFEGRTCDTRALFQKDRTGTWTFTGIGTRIGRANSVVSNLHAGAHALRTEEFIRKYIGMDPGPIINEIIKFGLKVGERLDQKFGNFVEFGLDIGITPQGTFQLIEANSKPARQILYKTKQIEKYQESIRKPIEYHLYLCSQL